MHHIAGNGISIDGMQHRIGTVDVQWMYSAIVRHGMVDSDSVSCVILQWRVLTIVSYLHAVWVYKNVTTLKMCKIIQSYMSTWNEIILTKLL